MKYLQWFFFFFPPACAPKIRCHNIYSRAWCVLCLLFMLQNGTRVITGKNLTVYKGEICFLIVFFWAPCIIIFQFLYWLCPCSPFLLTKKKNQSCPIIPTMSIGWHTNIFLVMTDISWPKWQAMMLCKCTQLHTCIRCSDKLKEGDLIFTVVHR